MVASDNTLEKEQYVVFRKILTLSEKLVYTPVYFPFEMPSNENSFKQLQTLCNLIVRRNNRERELMFYNKYLVLGCFIHGAK